MSSLVVGERRKFGFRPHREKREREREREDRERRESQERERESKIERGDPLFTPSLLSLLPNLP